MQIWLEGNLDAHDFIDPSYWHDNYELVKKELPNAQLYVDEEEGEIAGFVGMQGDDSRKLVGIRPNAYAGILDAMVFASLGNTGNLSVNKGSHGLRFGIPPFSSNGNVCINHLIIRVGELKPVGIPMFEHGDPSSILQTPVVRHRHKLQFACSLGKQGVNARIRHMSVPK